MGTRRSGGKRSPSKRGPEPRKPVTRQRRCEACGGRVLAAKVAGQAAVQKDRELPFAHAAFAGIHFHGVLPARSNVPLSHKVVPVLRVFLGAWAPASEDARGECERGPRRRTGSCRHILLAWPSV